VKRQGKKMMEWVLQMTVAFFAFLGIRRIFRAKYDSVYLRPKAGECFIVRSKKYKVVDSESKFAEKLRIPMLDTVEPLNWISEKTESNEVVPNGKLEYAVSMRERSLYINGCDVSFRDITGATAWICIRYRITDVRKLMKSSKDSCGEDFVNCALASALQGFSKVSAASYADYTHYYERGNASGGDFAGGDLPPRERKAKRSVTFSDSKNGTVGDLPNMIKVDLNNTMRQKGLSVISVMLLKLELPHEVRALMVKLMTTAAVDEREDIIRDHFHKREAARDDIAKHRFESMIKLHGMQKEKMSVDQILDLIKISYTTASGENFEHF
jgi:hypothetical protein